MKDFKEKLKSSWPHRIIFAIVILIALSLWYITIPILVMWGIYKLYKKSTAPTGIKIFAIFSFVLLLIVVSIINRDELSSTTSTPETNIEQASNQPNKTEVSQVNQPKQSFVESDLTADSIRKEIDKLDGLRSMSGSEISQVDIIDHAGTEEIEGDKIVAITYKPKSVWDEEDTVKKTADTTVAAAEKLFKHPKVGMVRVITTGDFTDQYGQSETSNAVRIGLQRPTAEKLNWDTFKDMVFVDYNKLLDIADEQWMHAAIRQSL